MNNYGQREGKGSCCFHPKEFVLGVCHLCLNERLKILASNQEQYPTCRRSIHGRSCSFTSSSRRIKPSISFSKIFSFGSSLLHRVDFRGKKSQDSENYSSTSQEDSFISIKFEGNGVASWEKGKVIMSKVISADQHSNMTLQKANHHREEAKDNNNRNTVEGQAKAPRATIGGRLFQLIRCDRSCVPCR